MASKDISYDVIIIGQGASAYAAALYAPGTRSNRLYSAPYSAERPPPVAASRTIPATRRSTGST